MGGFEMGDGSDSSGNWGLYFSSCPSPVGCSTTTVAKMLNGLGGSFKSFKLGGLFGSCYPNPFGIVGSFESPSRVTMSGSGDATE